MVTDRANIILSLNRKYVWASDWHIYVWPWTILQVMVIFTNNSISNIFYRWCRTKITIAINTASNICYGMVLFVEFTLLNCIQSFIVLYLHFSRLNFANYLFFVYNYKMIGHISALFLADVCMSTRQSKYSKSSMTLTFIVKVNHFEKLH